MSQNKKRRVAIVGGGVAALCFLKNLSEKTDLPESLELSWYEAPTLAPGCSFQSTALITDHGVKKGLSPLGDLLFEAYECAHTWYQNLSLEGIHKTEHWAIDDGSETFRRRYGDEHPSISQFLFHHPLKVRKAPALLINVDLFLPQLKASVIEALGIRPTHELVLDYDEENLLLTTNQTQREVDAVIWACGANPVFSKTLRKKDSKTSRLKTVGGYAFHYKGIDWGSRAFAFSVAGVNLIYRDQEVFLGGTTQKVSPRLPDASELLEQKNRLIKAGLDLSSLEAQKPHFWGGPRQKGQKRRAVIEQVSRREFAVLGLYKNGFSLAPYAAGKVISWLKAFDQ